MNVATRKNTDGTITAGKSLIYTPKIQFTGGTVNWYKDTYKTGKEDAV